MVGEITPIVRLPSPPGYPEPGIDPDTVGVRCSHDVTAQAVRGRRHTRPRAVRRGFA